MLWNTIDNANSKPKYLTSADKAKTVFVSIEESQFDANRKKGITGPGFWKFETYIDDQGDIRYKAECLVATRTLNAVSSDAADDAIVADSNALIAITVQPAAQTAIVGAAATFEVTATGPATLTYLWQKRNLASTDRKKWAAIAGATAATYETPVVVLTQNGEQYRVIVGSDAGALKVTSAAAALTVTEA